MQNIIIGSLHVWSFLILSTRWGWGGNNTHCTNEDTEAHRNKIICLWSQLAGGDVHSSRCSYVYTHWRQHERGKNVHTLMHHREVCPLDLPRVIPWDFSSTQSYLALQALAAPRSLFVLRTFSKADPRVGRMRKHKTKPRLGLFYITGSWICKAIK